MLAKNHVTKFRSRKRLREHKNIRKNMDKNENFRKIVAKTTNLCKNVRRRFHFNPSSQIFEKNILRCGTGMLSNPGWTSLWNIEKMPCCTPCRAYLLFAPYSSLKVNLVNIIFTIF
jgi:hypothetical protein